MKSFLVFYSQLDTPLTGGQVIDFDFIHQVELSNKFAVSYFLDSDMKSTTNIAYNLYLLTHVVNFLRYDIIFMNSRTYPRMLLFVLLLKFLCYKGKIITYHHHYNFETSYGWRKNVHKLSELLFLRCMSEILIPSPFVLDLTKKYIPKAKTIFIPIGFTKLCDKPRFTDRELNIVCVGNIDRRKRTHHIVEIANLLRNKYPNIKYDIVGGILDSEYNSEIEMLISKYQLEGVVKLHGRVSDDILSSIYKKALLFVFPSSYEGYGMVLVEAMSYGLPIIAYRNSAIPYTVKDEYNGLLVDDGNYYQMANAIKNLLEGKSISVLRDNCLSYINDLPSISDMRDKMLNYLSIIATD